MKMAKLTPGEVIALLERASPCPVVHELPGGEPSRSCYLPKRRGKRARDQAVIYMNEDPTRGWMYAQVLAHEIGHALDHQGSHPLKSALHGPRGRYRDELAAVAFEHLACQVLGMTDMELVRRRLLASVCYLERYNQGGHQSLERLLDEPGALDRVGEILRPPALALLGSKPTPADARALGRRRLANLRAEQVAKARQAGAAAKGVAGAVLALHDRWLGLSMKETAAIVREALPGARTSAKSVASILSRARRALVRI